MRTLGDIFGKSRFPLTLPLLTSPLTGEEQEGFSPQTGEEQEGVSPQPREGQMGVAPQTGEGQLGVAPQTGEGQMGVAPQTGEEQVGVAPQTGEEQMGVIPDLIRNPILKESDSMNIGLRLGGRSDGKADICKTKSDITEKKKVSGMTSRCLSVLKIFLMCLILAFTLTACSQDDTQQTSEQAPIQGYDSASLAKEHSECWQADIINPLYDLMGEAALKNYKHLTGGALSLMMVIFAVWMSFRLLKQVGSFKEETMGEVWTEIARMFFLCFVCGLIASQADLLIMVLGEVIFPIYNAFLEFASKLMATATGDVATTKSVTLFNTSYNVGSVNVCKPEIIGNVTSSDLRFPDGPKQMMNCMVCALSDNLNFGMKLSFQMLQTASFTSWLVGILVLLCFLFVKIGFAFYLIDTLFRFTVMVVILPLMIMAYPFPKSRGLLGKGVANMLNSAAFMMFFAIIITICIQAMSLTLKTFEKVMVGEEAFRDFSVPFVCIMMIGFLVISSVKIAGKLCDSFVGGKSNSEFQKDAKALIVGSIKFVASGGLKLLSMFVPNSVRATFNNATEKFMNLGRKVGGKADKMKEGL